MRSAGTLTFAWGHDDGFAFEVGDVVAFEFPGPTGSRVDRQALRFEAPGLYPFQLDWFDGIEGAVIDWYVATGDQRATAFTSDAGTVFRLVPTEDLYPTDALPCTPDCRPCPLEARRCDYARSRCVRCLDDGECPRCSRCVEGRCAGAGELPDGSTSPQGCVSPRRDAGVTADVTALDAEITDVSAPRRGAPGGGCGCRVEGRCSRVRLGPVASLMALLGVATASRRRKEDRRGR